MVRCLLSACLLLVAAVPAFAQQTVLLDFSIPGCAPCRQMDPIVGRLQQEGFPVRKVDGVREPQIAQRFGVQRYPTFVLVSSGREVGRFVGLKSYGELRQMLVAAGAGSRADRGVLQRRAGVVPATFAEPAPTAAPGPGAAYQVGSDLGPAPSVTIPGAPDPPAPRRASPASPGPAADELLSWSVRLNVHDAGGASFGTGTIIDARRGEALVLTCGHLFRDDQRRAIPSPEITVELFQPIGGGRVRVAERVAGQLISYDFEKDVALVSIRPAAPPRVARVAAAPAAVGGAVWSVGCDRGADPTVRGGRITTTDKYLSPPSLTATGAPVVGRSGGGLFNERGEVIGVCFGAYEAADEGFYAKLSSVHAELDKLGLAELYRGGRSTPQVASAVDTPAAGGMAPVRPRQPPAGSLVCGQNNFPASHALAGVSPTERAALEELSRRAAQSEVVCVIRPREPGGKSEVITLDRVSPEFLQALRAMRGAGTR